MQSFFAINFKPVLRRLGATQMDDVGKALLFLLIVFSLGTCFIAAFWKIEQARARWRGRMAEKARIARLAAFRGPAVNALQSGTPGKREPT